MKECIDSIPFGVSFDTFVAGTSPKSARSVVSGREKIICRCNLFFNAFKFSFRFIRSKLFVIEQFDILSILNIVSWLLSSICIGNRWFIFKKGLRFGV